MFLTLYWEADATTVHGDVFVRVHAVDAEGAGRLLWEGAPVHDTYPARVWLPNEIVADRYAGALPHDMPPGEYALRLRINDQDGGGVAVDLGPLTVEAVARTFTAPPFDERVDALFGSATSRGDAIRLLGVTIDPRTAQPGAVVNVELVWQAEAEIEQSYTVFVHLYNPDGTIRTQQDHPPVDGAYPTNLWAPGEVVVDRYALALPPDTPPGAYALGVGFYLQEGGARLPVGDTDWLDLGTVLVAE
ncbi:MAG: hypothetical protein M5R40_27965 [Anaerolineae bacterium]|nr:hypothetical protein [Anaerolineae bacterium]